LVGGSRSKSPDTAPAPVASTLEVAEPQATAFGIGGQLALSGFGGVQVVYNTDTFHIDGLVSFFDEVNTTISLGGRYFYHFNRSERADFSFGAGLGFTHINDVDIDVLHFEAVGQIRVFLTPAVVMSTTFGVALQSLDVDAVGLGTDLLGGTGISYLFY
tara:strand:- start:13638 stop:14114 length:477 start_codon:yes stop_codon:yes gene_type:complete